MYILSRVAVLRKFKATITIKDKDFKNQEANLQRHFEERKFE